MALDIKYNNCHGRLLAVLRHIRAAPANQRLTTVYAEIFPSTVRSTPNNGETLTLDSLSIQLDLNELIDSVLADAESLRETNDDFALFFDALKPADQLRNLLSPLQIVQNCAKVFTDSVEMALVTFAQASSTEPAIEENELAAIRTAVDALMDQIESSTLPRSIREFLFNMQRASRDMIDRFRISGVRGLKPQFHRVLGEMADVYRADEKKSEERKSFWQAVTNVIRQFDNVVSKAQKYPALVDKSGAAVDVIEGFLE